MRLGQLARKLALRPDQIKEFLAKKNIQIEDGSNTRLEDNYVALVVGKFAPSGFEITPQELKFEEENAEILPPMVIEAEIENSETNIELAEEPVKETEALQEKTEVIKAPKIELSGLKVLGKIDLPELKKKEQPIPIIAPQPNTEGEKEIKPAQEEKRSPIRRNPKPTPRPTKNPIALQREREEMEAQKKREAAKALEKERRAQHYFSKVKVVTPVKTSKHDQTTEEVAEPIPQPKTLLGKFFRWFTT